MENSNRQIYNESPSLTEYELEVLSVIVSSKKGPELISSVIWLEDIVLALDRGIHGIGGAVGNLVRKGILYRSWSEGLRITWASSWLQEIAYNV